MPDENDRSGDVHASLERLSLPSTDEWPILLECSDPSSSERVEGWIGDGRILRYVDGLAAQIRELSRARRPELEAESIDDERLARELFPGLEERARGTWVFYPWSGLLTRVLPAPWFRELRTSRNRHKISSAEQLELSRARIGIVGLSVGQVVATTLALEGVGGSFHIADFDTTELSNLNRMPCGLGGLGQNKARLAARMLSEIDPFLEVRVFPEGIDESNEDEFLEDGRRLSLLVEECDDLATKVRLRERARAYGIPVICETNDRGLMDVERFDREPTRPILHGLLENLSHAEVAGLDTRQKIPFVLRFLGGVDEMSPRLAASLLEVDRSLAGWSQLGSGTTLGGAAVTDVARRILLGKFNESGRFRVDLEGLVADGMGSLLQPVEPDAPKRPDAHPELGARVAAKMGEEMVSIVEAARAAPSGGNSQPWRFVVSSERRLEIEVEPSRAGGVLDFRREASRLACGAAACNAALAAAGLGWVTHCHFGGSPESPFRVAALDFEAGEPEAADLALAPQIGERVTNRRLSRRVPFRSEDGDRLQREVRRVGGELVLVTGAVEIDRLGELLGDYDRFRFMSERLHREMMQEIRWSPEEAAITRDGIELATLEGDEADEAGLMLLRSWPVVSELRALGAGQGLSEPAKRSVASASAMCLVRQPDAGEATFFRGGMAMERAWLAASELGLALQPMSIATFLNARFDEGDRDGLLKSELDTLGRLRVRFSDIFPRKPGWRDVFLFRLATAPPPSARSLRLELDDLVDIE